MNKEVLWYFGAIVIVLIVAGISMNGYTPEIKEAIKEPSLLPLFFVIVVFLLTIHQPPRYVSKGDSTNE